MCGIAGVFNQSRAGVRAMVAAMRHRGPDDSGIFADAKVVLGMTRLAILDTSAAGHQPMSNEDESVWIVYNGEAYNFREERQRLESAGVRFRSSSDTEVVLRLYEESGAAFLRRLRGMFALALYDRRPGRGRERLLLARDPLGIKPLLYAEAGSGLVFASEMKALLASGLVRPEIDPEALRLLLTFGAVPQPRTILKNVSMLSAGHCMIVQGGARTLEAYWRLGTGRIDGLGQAPYGEQVARVRHEVEESLRLQLVSDVPLGAFLSGGVDSSILVGLMARHARGRVRTFSIGFGEEGTAIDESVEAGRTASTLGTEHLRVLVTERDVRDRIEDFARALDQPSMDGLNAYFVSDVARRAVTVAVSGTGGDELFAGYPWFADMIAHSKLRPPPASALLGRFFRGAALDHLAVSDSWGRLEQLRAAGGFLPHYARLHAAFGASRAGRLLAPELRELAAIGREPSRDIARQDELPHANAVARVSALCLRGYTQNQLLRDIDAVSMSRSLEVRVPLLDQRLVDVALSLPDEAKLGSGGPTSGAMSYRASGAKRVLIDAFRDVLPPDFDLQPKRGFSMPHADWLRGSLQEVMRDALSPQSVARRGFFAAEEVAGVLDRFARGQAPWTHPWLLMITELWCRQVLDQANVCRAPATAQ
jgi:asparagine synthase (glutamine-hydrolysing)